MATPAEQYDLLPQPPQQQRPHQRPEPQYAAHQPRTQTKPRSFSVRSDKSHRSAGSKSDYYETHEEKESHRLHSKADPTLAINEAEPSTVAMNAQSNHAPLRSLQHKDVWGNPITDPDKSNPTRNRWERPLDTIRSFEAAIDGGYTRKIMRSDTDSSANWNQRTGSQSQNQPRYPHDPAYGNRPSSFRTDTHYGSSHAGTTRNSYMDSQPGHGGGHGRHPRDRGPRMHGEPHYQVYGREQNVYPMPHKDRSYETVTSAAPSGGSDPAGYQTDPTSSDNSSVDRVSPAKRREPHNDYGIGFSHSQPYHTPSFSIGRSANAHDHALPPAQMEPRYYDADSGNQTLAEAQASRPQRGVFERRKSWFSRRFSKDA